MGEALTMGVCAQCGWFRRVKPASQLLAPQFETTAGDVAEALGKIVEDEQKQRDAESEFKRAQAAAGKDTWLSRPVMTEYCGFKEAEGAYFIAEVKNAGGACDDHDPEMPERHACEDCGHYVPPEGEASDAKIEEMYIKLAAKGIHAKVEKDTTEQSLETFRGGVAARKALEVAGIYQTKGHQLTKPDYVAICAHYSTPDDYVVCLFQNPYHTCPSWQAKQEAPMPETSDTAATPAAPQSSGAATAPPVALPPLVGVTDAPAQTSSVGSSAVTPEVLQQTCVMLEWMLGVQLPADVRKLVEDGVASEWRTQDAATTAGHMALLEAHQNAVAAGADQAEYLRELYQPEFVAGLRAQSDPASQALVQLYDAANPPLAPGSPPLTREVADAYLGILSFVDALMENRTWMPMPEPSKALFAQQMAAGYGNLSPMMQQWLSVLPLEWAKTRALWQAMPEPDRTTLASQLIGQFGPVAQLTPMLAESPTASMPVVGAAPTGLQAATTNTTATGTSVADKGVDDLLLEIQEHQRKDEEEAAKESPELAAQVKLQNQLANASMLSNIMKMRHDAAMTIAGNIK